MSAKEFLHGAFDIHDDSADHDTIRERIVSGGQVTGTNMCVLVLAILIASIGLNMNSTAVVIGAMLISPLMGSILAIAYAGASADMDLFRKSSLGFGFQILFSLATSILYFSLSPISTATSELLARTSPTIWDVMIAICGGLAGSIGITRKEKSNVIPGVAIATALMPPLCTVGYSIATLQWRYAIGAAYLFAVNTYFILLSAVIILVILNVPRLHTLPPERLKKLRRALVRNTILFILPSIVVAGFMVAAQNEDETALTGFNAQSAEHVLLAREIEALYPQVENVVIADGEQYSDDTALPAEQQFIIIRCETPLSQSESDQLHAWLAEAYPDAYLVITSSKP